MFEKQSIERGYLGSAQWGLAKEIWTREPKRAHALIADALGNLEHGNATWNKTRKEASDWLATDGKPKTKSR